ncbi:MULTISPECIES: putative quinol monooxygenase [unclassified Leucobacter]|uniref:putative quinol monooxygenase n=1 Tax=unclassified Leucobacter TaxID=2621730 RepID=UPI00165DF198|nr:MULTISPECIES: antibiotic biosynthesis monooxygenase [unclassified Leucobacter]MBC9936856.1 antibiotic biosynthesis monooxygenase [Leucobacter sp. cx-87]
MNEIVLTGQLICSHAAEADIVRHHLPRHAELSRAEHGCLSFEVAVTPDPLIWQVDERFVDVAAFRAHQHRASASEWGQATAAIRRSYTVREIPPANPQ